MITVEKRPKYDPLCGSEEHDMRSLGSVPPGEEVTIYIAATTRRGFEDHPREPLYGELLGHLTPELQPENPVVLVRIGDRILSFGASTAARLGKVISRDRLPNPNY